jgi:uncharacterized membrane protein
MSEVMNDQKADEKADEKTKMDQQMTTAIYVLYAVALLVGITYLAAIVMYYVKRDDITDPILQSHWKWQARTFWYSLLWSLIGIATMVVIIGFFILFANLVWYIYRVVKGWTRLNENKPMYAD